MEDTYAKDTGLFIKPSGPGLNITDLQTPGSALPDGLLAFSAIIYTSILL